MGLLNIITQMALREQLPIREIARRTGLSRNTIKKHLNSGNCRAQVRDAGSSQQARSIRRQACGLVEDGSREVTQAAPDAEAASCRSGGAWLHWLLRSCGSFCAELASRSSAGTADHGTRLLCSAVLSSGRSFPIRLERGFCHSGRRTHQVRESPTSSCHIAGPSWFGPICCKPMRCCSMHIGMASASSAACRGVASTTT